MVEDFTAQLENLHKEVQAQLEGAPDENQAKTYQQLLNNLLYNESQKASSSAIQTEIFKVLEKQYGNSYQFKQNDEIALSYVPTEYKKLTEDEFNKLLKSGTNKIVQEKQEEIEQLEKHFSFIGSAQKSLAAIYQQLTKIDSIEDLKNASKVGEDAKKFFEDTLNKINGAIAGVKQNHPQDEAFWNDVQKILNKEIRLDEASHGKDLSRITSSAPGLKKHGIGLESYNALMKFLEAIDWIIQGQLPTKIKGDALEFFLNATAEYALQGIDDVVEEEFLKKITNKSTGGEKSVWEKSTIDFTVKVSDSKENKTKTIPKVDFEMPLADGTKIEIKCEHFNPFTERQGKADVIFETQVPNPPANSKKTSSFKISAKNWMMSGSFGETYWVYGVIRSLGKKPQVLSSLLKFFKKQYQNNDENQSNALESAHNLAKYSILIDILMGYSQKNQSANIVVIHFQNKGFVVFPILSVLNSIVDKKAYNILAHYPTEDDFKEIAKEKNFSSYVSGLKFTNQVALYYTQIKQHIPNNLLTI